jgi:hypothetical protein
MWILEQAASAGCLSPKTVFIGGTHIQAGANTKKQVKAVISVASQRYAPERISRVNAVREAHGKEPFEDEKPSPAPPKNDGTTCLGRSWPARKGRKPAL